LNEIHGFNFGIKRLKQAEEFAAMDKALDDKINNYLQQRSDFDEEKESLRIQAEIFLSNFNEEDFENFTPDLQNSILIALKNHRYEMLHDVSDDITPTDFSKKQLDSYLEYVNMKDKVTKKVLHENQNGTKVTHGKFVSDPKKKFMLLEGKNVMERMNSMGEEEIVQMEDDIEEEDSFKPLEEEDDLEIELDDVQTEHLMKMFQPKHEEVFEISSEDEAEAPKVGLKRRFDFPESVEKKAKLDDPVVIDTETLHEIRLSKTLVAQDQEDDDTDFEIMPEAPERSERNEPMSVPTPKTAPIENPPNIEVPFEEIITLESPGRSPVYTNPDTTTPLRNIQQEPLLENSTDVPIELNEPPTTLQVDPNNIVEHFDDITLDQFYEEDMNLQGEMAQSRKKSAHVTRSLIEQTKELLDLLGIPHITAPYEADAQCAYYNQIGAVDTVITEDSDVFLFGATSICSNIFSRDDNDHPEIYTMKNIESTMKLDRSKLIQLGYLLGGDYTDGVRNCGIVNAMECVVYFHNEKEVLEENISTSLHDFANWVRDLTIPEKGSFEDKIFKQKVKFVLPMSFPEDKIMNAYISPIVKQDVPDFKWGNLEMDKLYQFTSDYMQMTAQETDQLVKPALENRNNSQTNIQSFFIDGAVGEVKSKRLQKAIEKLNVKK
jgi:5'-3' exonuclease